VQAVGSGLCGRQLRARDESALEVAPPDLWFDRWPTAFTTMRYTNQQPLPFYLFSAECTCVIGDFHIICKLAASVGQKNVNSCYVSIW